MLVLVGLLLILITLISIEGQLKKRNKQNDEILDLLHEIKNRL